MPVKGSSLIVRGVEMLSYAVGALMAGFFVVQLAQGEVQRREGIADFSQAPLLVTSTDYGQSTPGSGGGLQLPTFGDTLQPDTSNWNPGRVVDYQNSLKADLPPVLGVLEIPSVGLEVAVYPTDSDLTMDRGAGVIDGMSYPHELGNIGIAGHRDGYFRALKDVKLGDTITLATLQGPKIFTIDSTQIVDISDTALLQDTSDQTVTLVTCYPFYFVGHAPKRFIVTASLDPINVNLQ